LDACRGRTGACQDRCFLALPLTRSPEVKGPFFFPWVVYPAGPDLLDHFRRVAHGSTLDNAGLGFCTARRLTTGARDRSSTISSNVAQRGSSSEPLSSEFWKAPSTAPTPPLARKASSVRVTRWTSIDAFSFRMYSRGRIGIGHSPALHSLTRLPAQPRDG